MRSLGSELATVVTVLSIPAGIALVLPYEAFEFKAMTRTEQTAPVAAFVRLSPEQETRAMLAAKTSWQDDGSARRQRADIYFAELPEESFPSVMPDRERRRDVRAPIVSCEITPFLPSRRAAPPVRIVPDAKVEDPLPFPREELLKID